MSQNKTAETQDAAILKESAAQGDMEAKREMARRLLIGDGVDKDQAKAVSILEDCVARGDTDAMVMLAKCCALAHGMEHNAGRAEARPLSCSMPHASAQHFASITMASASQ